MQTANVQQVTVEERKTIAREQSALFPTKLALARWTSGAELPHPHTENPPVRAAWLAQAQRDFQAWLDNGGFVQHDMAPANDAAEPASDPAEPAGDSGATPDGLNTETWAI
jgi:hypothetical protein